MGWPTPPSVSLTSSALPAVLNCKHSHVGSLGTPGTLSMCHCGCIAAQINSHNAGLCIRVAPAAGLGFGRVAQQASTAAAAAVMAVGPSLLLRTRQTLPCTIRKKQKHSRSSDMTPAAPSPPHCVSLTDIPPLSHPCGVQVCPGWATAGGLGDETGLGGRRYKLFASGPPHVPVASVPWQAMLQAALGP